MEPVPGLSNGYAISSGFRFPILESPNDPTIHGRQTGLASYAYNATAVNRNDVRFADFSDGQSNTVLFGEHYAYHCANDMFSWAVGTYDPDPGETHRFRPSAFALEQAGDVVPVTAKGRTSSSKAGLTFQTQPRLKDCDPKVAQGLQPGGMLVGLADGSVRLMNRNVDESVYWSAVTRDRGEPRGNW